MNILLVAGTICLVASLTVFVIVAVLFSKNGQNLFSFLWEVMTK